MDPTTKQSKFDLEERTLQFAKRIRVFVSQLPMSLRTSSDTLQLLRSSGSVGANYIEANGSLGKRDFLMRLRIAIKEAKESRFWLELLHLQSPAAFQKECAALMDECHQIVRILGAIIRNTTV